MERPCCPSCGSTKTDGARLFGHAVALKSDKAKKLRLGPIDLPAAPIKIATAAVCLNCGHVALFVDVKQYQKTVK